MTDRLKGVLVTFDQDIREDDAAQIIAAIRMIKRVADVKPLVCNVEDEMARIRVDLEWRKKLSDLLFDKGNDHDKQ
jgi:hypothetical protein